MMVIVGIVLLLQGTSAFIEHGSNLYVSRPSESALLINKNYGLDTVFYKKKLKNDLSYYEEIDNAVMLDVMHAGRALLIATTAHAAYLPRQSILELLGVEKVFKPCNKSLYGRSTPNEYVEILDGEFVNRRC